MDGIVFLLTLSIVMAVASFLAGALPLSMSLSSSQLRMISSLGMGVLVGTSLITIIPEGIKSIYSAGSFTSESHLKRSLPGVTSLDSEWTICNNPFKTRNNLFWLRQDDRQDTAIPLLLERADSLTTIPSSENTHPEESKKVKSSFDKEEIERGNQDVPTFYTGLSLVSGFILMFLIDKLSRRASERLQSAPPTRHISLSNFSLNSPSMDTLPESESFLHSLTPTLKQTRSLTTTTGLVIHAVADGVAIGASISSSNMKLGSIIFIAIMLHKAPAAFGLTSVLLKQGLSKRAARGHLIIFSLATPAGAITTWLLIALLAGSHNEGERGRWWTGMLLLVSAGTFLYVSMHAMQEENINNHIALTSSSIHEFGNNAMPHKAIKPKMRDTLAAIGGMLIPLLTQLDHRH